MDPISASNGTGVATGLMDALAKSRTHTQHLLDAVQGAQHKKSMWHSLCKELGDNCKTIVPLLDQLQTELQQSTHMSDTMEAMEAAMDALGLGLQDGTALVVQCQTATRSTLFVRGGFVKEKFHKVAECIVQCLCNISLTSITLTAHIQDAIGLVVEQLEMARFEMSEEDRAIFKDIQQVLDSEGVQSEDTHLATLSVLRQIENRLNMNLGDITQEIRATRGNGAVDLDSMEQSFMSQILRLFVERSNGVGAGISSSVGNVGVGPSSSRSAQSIRSGPPANVQDVSVCDRSHSFHGEASSSGIEKSSTSVQNVEFKDDFLHHRSTPTERSTATVASGGSPINQNGKSLSLLDVPIQISTEDLSISPETRVRILEFVEFPNLIGRNSTCIGRVGAQYTVVLEGEDQKTVNVHEKNLEAASPGKRDAILPPPCSTPVVSTHAQEHVHGACRSPINSKPSSEDTFEANCEPQELGPLLQVVSANESQSGSSSSKPADHPNAPAATNRPQEPRTRLQDDHKNPIYEQPTKRNSFSLTCCRSMLFAFVLVIIVVVTILVGFALGWDGGDTKNNDSQEEGDVVRILSRVSFSRLDMAVLNDPVFAGGFRSHFTNAMATAAGVSSGSVSIGLISSGSVMVSSEIGFGSQAMAEAFFDTLLDNAGAIFMDTPLEQYGPVTVVIDHFSPALIAPKAPSPPSPRTPPPYFPPPPPASSTPSPQDVPSSTAPTATSTYSVFTFIHPCTNETLRSTTTTYLDFDSECATTIPTQLGWLTMLTHLSFSSASSLTGTIPTQLAQLTALKHLSISGATALIGPIPSHFGQLTALTYLSFSSMTSVKGTIPTQLGQLTMIKWLSFYGATSLTGTIPTHFGQLTALTYLDFYYARSLTGTIPTQLGSMTMLSCLYFSSASSLKGTIPTQLGLLTSLTLLSFSSVSSLTGTIPTQLGQLTSLTRIDFTWARMIAGTIPTHFGQLTTLKFLSFYYAMSLSGTIPTQLGQLTSLKSLFFSYASSLTGTIPMHLGYLTALQSLDFSGALSLTGTIPVEVHQLTALTYCNDQSGKSFCVDV